MSSKVGKLIKDISQAKEKITPEKIAEEYMNWRSEAIGKNISYFKKGERSDSRAWKYFERLSDLLNMWKDQYIKVALYEYFFYHYGAVGKKKGDLYPSQLVLPYSHNLVLGKGPNPEVFRVSKYNYEKELQQAQRYAETCSMELEEIIINIGVSDRFIQEYLHREYNINISCKAIREFVRGSKY